MKDDEEWVHATNAVKFREGDVFGWPDKRSETGWLSGIVVRADHMALRVLVKDIRAAIVKGSKT